MEKTVSKFLQSLGVSISKRYVERIISSHAEYPSLLSIADALERLGIDYRVWRIKKEELENVAFPYLLPLSSGEGDIILIEKKNDLEKIIEKLKDWDGVIFYAKAPGKLTDKENNQLYMEEKLTRWLTIFLLCASSVLLLLPFIFWFSWINIVLFTTALGGMIIGYILVAKDLGIKFDAVESFCNAGKNANCDKVLNSNESKILGIAKFSDLVMIYFSFQAIILSLSTALPNTTTSLLFVLSSISFITVPVVFYSIYYQYFKAKVWCKLCLIIDATLIIQVIIFISNESFLTIISVNLITVLLSLFAFLLISTSFLILKGILERMNKSERAEVKTNRIKNSVAVFTHLLFQQRRIDATPFEYELIIGSTNAPIKIIVVSNLFCEPCKVNHSIAADLIAKYPNKISLSIRLSIRTMQPEFGPIPGQYILQYWLKNIYGKSNESVNTEILMNDWFALMDLEKFKKKYLNYENDNLQSAVNLADKHHKWLLASNIVRTPTFFINGYELPRSYRIEDLVSLIPALADSFQKEEYHVLQNV